MIKLKQSSLANTKDYLCYQCKFSNKNINLQILCFAHYKKGFQPPHFRIVLRDRKKRNLAKH